MTDRTEWFSGDSTPKFYGAYERVYDKGTADESVAFCKYAGAWFEASLTPRGAIESRVISPLQYLDWRGLAEDPDQ